MHETTLTLSYQSPRSASTVEAALKPEAGDVAGDRTAVTITRSGNELTLTIKATDTVSLRAGQNTWLGFVEVAEAIELAGDRFDQGPET